MPKKVKCLKTQMHTGGVYEEEHTKNFFALFLNVFYVFRHLKGVFRIQFFMKNPMVGSDYNPMVSKGVKLHIFPCSPYRHVLHIIRKDFGS